MTPTPPLPTASPAPGLRTPFTYSLFRAIWIASLVSNVGTWMQNVAGVWLVTTLTTSALLVALMQTATSLPAFLLSMPAGAIGDLIDRRKLLLFTQGFMALVALGLGVFALAGGIRAIDVLGFTFLLGMGAALNGPIWQTVTTELVPRPVLPFAITLNGVSNNIARAIGPALGGLIIAYYQPGWVFVLNGVSFVGTWMVVYHWRRAEQRDGGPAENFSGALRAGIRYVQYSPPLVAVLVRTGAFSLGASAMWALLSVVVARQLHLQSGSYAVMLSWLGAGAVAGAFLIGRIGYRLNLNRRVLLGSLMFVITNLALASVGSGYWLQYANTHAWFAAINREYLLFPVMFLSGTAWLLTMTSFSTSVQLHVPKWVQARAVSIYMLVFQAGMSLGSIVWGELADRSTLTVALLAAATWMLGSLALALPFPMHQPEGLDFSPAEPWSDQLPAVEEAIGLDDGPVVVMIDYDVAAADHAAFRLAAQQLTRLRLRDGALRAGVFTDVSQSTRITEFFYVATWAEHERQHHRFTRDDQLVEAEVRRFHQGDAPPRVTHFLAFPRTPNVEMAAPPLQMAGSAQ